MNALLAVAVLFTTVWIGAAIAWLFAQQRRHLLPGLLAFSGGYILAVTVLHLLPDVYSHNGIEVGWMVLSGLLLQLFLEHFSGGVEHGHVHLHGRMPGFALSVGLGLHSLFEGMPLGATDGRELPLLLAIVWHKLPAAMALTAMCMNYRRRFPWLIVAFFSIASPLGVWLGEVMPVLHERAHTLLALVAGSFLHIATTIVFETDPQSAHQVVGMRIAALLLGIGAGALSL